jgi:hypothetical protein
VSGVVGPLWTDGDGGRYAGRFPLAVERHAMAQVGHLLPGITTVTPHARYYTLHAAVFAEARAGGLDEAATRRLLRRAEVVVGAVSMVHGKANPAAHAGMRSPHGSDHLGSRLAHRADIDALSADGAYAQAGWGFWGPYVASEFAMGLLATEGKKTVEGPNADRAALRAGFDGLFDLADRPALTVDQLAAASHMCVCQTRTSADGLMLQQVLIPESASAMHHDDRRAQTLRMLLRLTESPMSAASTASSSRSTARAIWMRSLALPTSSRTSPRRLAARRSGEYGHLSRSPGSMVSARALSKSARSSRNCHCSVLVSSGSGGLVDVRVRRPGGLGEVAEPGGKLVGAYVVAGLRNVRDRLSSPGRAGAPGSDDLTARWRVGEGGHGRSRYGKADPVRLLAFFLCEASRVRSPDKLVLNAQDPPFDQCGQSQRARDRSPVDLRTSASLGGEELRWDPLFDRGPTSRSELGRVDDTAFPEMASAAPLQEKTGTRLRPVDRQRNPAVSTRLIQSCRGTRSGRLLVAARADAVLQRDASPASVTTSCHAFQRTCVR